MLRMPPAELFEVFGGKLLVRAGNECRRASLLGYAGRSEPQRSTASRCERGGLSNVVAGA